MKNLKIALTFFISLFLLSAGAALAGTGVGNAGDGARAAYIAKLRKEMNLDRERDTPEDLIEWCQRVTRVLKREKIRAGNLIEVGNFAAAKTLLLDAMIQASQSLAEHPADAHPMTKRMIDRGLVYEQELESIMSAVNAKKDAKADAIPLQHEPTLGEFDLLTLINFLDKFVDLVIHAEAQVDRPYFSNYYNNRHNRGQNSEFNFDRFRRSYIDHICAEIRFIMTALVSIRHDGPRVIVTPIGKPEVFLKVAELSTTLLADEIERTLERYRYAVTTADMRALSSDIRDFNLNRDRTIYPTTPRALIGVASSLHSFLNSLQGNDSQSYPRNYGVRLNEQTLRIPQNTSQMVPLTSPRHVHKIEVMGEARNEDAIVEVRVNGEVKGTLYLPRRDPHYVVTIEETAAEIEFRNIAGGIAVITTVTAFFDGE